MCYSDLKANRKFIFVWLDQDIVQLGLVLVVSTFRSS